MAADGGAELGGVRLAIGGTGEGIVGWTLRDLASVDLDGLPTSRSEDAGRPAPPTTAGEHPLGAIGVDHVVIATTSLDRTGAALAAAGLPLRRINEAKGPAGPARQGFVRAGAAIVEPSNHPPPWGTAAQRRRASGDWCSSSTISTRLPRCWAKRSEARVMPSSRTAHRDRAPGGRARHGGRAHHGGAGVMESLRGKLLIASPRSPTPTSAARWCW